MPKDICPMCREEKDGVRERILKGATEEEPNHVAKACRPCSKNKRVIKR